MIDSVKRREFKFVAPKELPNERRNKMIEQEKMSKLFTKDRRQKAKIDFMDRTMFNLEKQKLNKQKLHKKYYDYDFRPEINHKRINIYAPKLHKNVYDRRFRAEPEGARVTGDADSETKDSIRENIRDLQKHLEKLEKQRRDSRAEEQSNNFSDFKPEHRHLPRPPENSLKYSYSITNKKSVESFQPQFANSRFAANDARELSQFSRVKKKGGMASQMKTKGNIHSEKIFKKNKIHHYVLHEHSSRNYAKSFFRPNTAFADENEYLNLTSENLVSKNPVSNITNLADESVGVSKNTNGNLYSGFLKMPPVSRDAQSKNSHGSEKQLFFEDLSDNPIMNF